MTISAPSSLEFPIEFNPERVLDFKTFNVSLAAVETTGIGKPEFLPTPLKARRPPDWIRIVQLSTPGKT